MIETCILEGVLEFIGSLGCISGVWEYGVFGVHYFPTGMSRRSKEKGRIPKYVVII